MRVLIASDAPWHPTGYGVQLKAFAQRMVKDGHRVYIYCAGAFMGGYVDYGPGITVVGAGGNDDRWGNRSWGEVSDWVDPDVIFTWLDVHGMAGYGWNEAPTYMWAPIDTEPSPKEERDILGRAALIMVPSQWGRGVVANEGFESVYVPCGVDLSVYDIDPQGRKDWRAQFRPEIDDDTFLVGMVGLNTGVPDRKGYGYAFDVIKAFVDNHPGEKIQVYIHTDAYGDGMAINLFNLRERLGLENVVAFNPPQLPWGRPEKYMRDMYNAFDVYLTTTQTEGFGVPVVEAQACGVPVVVNACSAVTELAQGPGAYRARYLCDSWVNTCTKIYIPDVRSLTLQLEGAYADWKLGRFTDEMKREIRDSVRRFEMDYVYETYWRPLLATVPPKINYEDAGAAVGPKLMLAAGQEQQEGFVHHDRAKLWPHIELTFDLNDFPWPLEDDSYGYVEMSDVLEHLKGDLVQVMDELHRIIRPGGYVYIHTAEAGSWQLMKDPTHVQGFMTDSFDYFDPERPFGQTYSYSDRKWRVVKRTADNGGLVFVMQPRKTVVEFVEHFPDESGAHNPEKCARCQAETPETVAV